jgi:hypothetical protein
MSDNRLLLEAIARRVSDAAERTPVIFGGDLNTFDSADISAQLAPLLGTGMSLVPPEHGAKRLITWHIAVPLTRDDPYDPGHKQLDFLMSKPCAHPQHNTRVPGRLFDDASDDARPDTRRGSPRVTFCDGEPLTFDEQSTSLHKPEAFALPGAPLSDHIGLLATFR